MTQEENKKSRSYQSGKTADENPKEGLVSIDKSANWLEMINLVYYQIREGVFSRELVTDFRKAMEEFARDIVKRASAQLNEFGIKNYILVPEEE